MRKLLLALLIILIPSALAVGFDVDKPAIKVAVTDGGEVAFLTVTNSDLRTGEFSLSSNLASVSLSESEFSLNSGDSKTVTITLNQPSRINSFNIIITSGDEEKVVPVLIELEDVNPVYDSEIVIDSEYRNIKAGEKVVANLDIMGISDESQRITMTYSLWDYNNNEIFSKSQEIIVNGRNVGGFEINTPTYLVPGRYVVAVVLKYQTQWSTATESITIDGEPQKPSLFLNPYIIAAIAGAFIIIVYLFRKTHHHLKRLELAHWSSAFEFRKHRLHIHRKALRKRLESINKHLELGNISKETHAAHHSYITQKIDEIDHILGLK